MNLRNIFHKHRSLRYAPFFILGGLLLLAIILLPVSGTVQALPEYATRTGEPCAACHVSAGGGGPRTLRGLLWSARGKPDKVPILPGMLLAPHVSDGGELYQVACSGCHGIKGEGLSARGLAGNHISLESIRSFTVKGIPQLGMPAFKGQFTDSQLSSLIDYVTGLSNGTIPPPADSYRLAPALFRCPPDSSDPACSAGYPESGGN